MIEATITCLLYNKSSYSGGIRADGHPKLADPTSGQPTLTHHITPKPIAGVASVI